MSNQNTDILLVQLNNAGNYQNYINTTIQTASAKVCGIKKYNQLNIPFNYMVNIISKNNLIAGTL